MRLAELRWRIEHDYRELKDALGLELQRLLASWDGTRATPPQTAAAQLPPPRLTLT